MKLKLNKFLYLSYFLIIVLIGISFFNFYKPIYDSVHNYNIIKENCYLKKNTNLPICKERFISEEKWLEYYIKNNNPNEKLNNLDAITVTLEIIEHEMYTNIQFLAPLIIMIAVVFKLHSEYSNCTIKNYLTRMNYKDYLKSKYKYIFRASLIIPVSLIIIFIIACFMTGFNFNYSDSVKNIAVYTKIKYQAFPLYFLSLLLTQYIMCLFYANIGIFVIKKTKNSILSVVLGYILFLVIDIIIYCVLYAFILFKLLHLKLPLDVFNITGYLIIRNDYEVILFLISSIILFVISFIILKKYYKNKEEVVCYSERQNA